MCIWWRCVWEEGSVHLDGYMHTYVHTYTARSDEHLCTCNLQGVQMYFWDKLLEVALQGQVECTSVFLLDGGGYVGGRGRDQELKWFGMLTLCYNFFPSAWDLLKLYSEEELVYPHCILNLQELGRYRDGWRIPHQHSHPWTSSNSTSASTRPRLHPPNSAPDQTSVLHSRALPGCAITGFYPLHYNLGCVWRSPLECSFLPLLPHHYSLHTAGIQQTWISEGMKELRLSGTFQSRADQPSFPVSARSALTP